MPEQATNKIEETPICGICGELMVYRKGEYKCEICEYFLGTSSRVNTCSQCGNKFGRYKVVEERFLSIFHLTEEGRRELNRRLCPRCRRESPYFNEIRETLVEKIKYELEQENFTGYELASQIIDLTSKNVEFFRYCSGDVEGYLEYLLSLEVYTCAYCGRAIGRLEGKNYICPPQEENPDFNNPKCVWFHGECFRKWIAEAREAGKDVRGNVWDYYMEWMQFHQF